MLPSKLLRHPRHRVISRRAVVAHRMPVAVARIRRDLLPERHEVPPLHDLRHRALVSNVARAAKMVRRAVVRPGPRCHRRRLVLGRKRARHGIHVHRRASVHRLHHPLAVRVVSRRNAHAGGGERGGQIVGVVGDRSAAGRDVGVRRQVAGGVIRRGRQPVRRGREGPGAGRRRHVQRAVAVANPAIAEVVVVILAAPTRRRRTRLVHGHRRPLDRDRQAVHLIVLVILRLRKPRRRDRLAHQVAVVPTR